MPDPLPDSSAVRVFAAEPALGSGAAAELAAAVDRLLAQFVREGRCARAAASVEGDGRFLVVAWDGPALSGCSHDKLAQVVAVHEARSGCRLLDAPPIAVGDPLRLVDRPGLRGLSAAGAVHGGSPWWDLRAATLGAWRGSPRTLAESPFARSLGAAS